MPKEIFDVKITKNSSPENIYEIYGCNSFCNYLVFNLKKDIFNVNSNLGSYTGLKMAGGTININGSVKDFLGAEMTGGFINVKKMQEIMLVLVCMGKVRYEWR